MLDATHFLVCICGYICGRVRVCVCVRVCERECVYVVCTPLAHYAQCLSISSVMCIYIRGSVRVCAYERGCVRACVFMMFTSPICYALCLSFASVGLCEWCVLCVCHCRALHDASHFFV